MLMISRRTLARTPPPPPVMVNPVHVCCGRYVCQNVVDQDLETKGKDPTSGAVGPSFAAHFGGYPGPGAGPCAPVHVQEFSGALRCLAHSDNIELTEGDVQMLMDHVDTDADGQISWHEFLQALGKATPLTPLRRRKTKKKSVSSNCVIG